MKSFRTVAVAALFLGGMVGVADAATFGTWVDATARVAGGGIVDHAFDAPSTTTGFADATITQGSSSGTATAAADIAGILRVYASAAGRNGIAVATASFYDTLTYTAPSGFNGTSLQVTYSLHVFGSVSGHGYPDSSNYWYGFISDAAGQRNVQYNTNPNYNPGKVPALTDFWVTYTRILPVVGNQASNKVSFGTGAYAAPSDDGLSITLDFSHTALVSQTLPDGWTFSSASGTFLQGAPVPIPSALFLLAPALVGAAAFRRRLKA